MINLQFTRILGSATLVVVIGLYWTLSTINAQSRNSQTDPPNIILLVSDNHDYRGLGSFGGEEVKSPNLDRLAEEGVRLTNFYAAWPACTPSRASFLTGRYPQRHGMHVVLRNNMKDYGHIYKSHEYEKSYERVLGLDTREVLISDVLKEHGYYTGVFGKWDIGSLRRFLPLQRGFDEFYGFTSTGVDYYTHERTGVHMMYRDNERTKEDVGTFSTHLFRREAVRFLRKNHDRRFFLYVPFHQPAWTGVERPAEYLERFPDVDNESRRNYLAGIAAMDDVVGEILDLLEQHEVEENTIVIFFADDAGGGAAEFTGTQGSTFEAALRVPAIIRWPGKIPAGKVSDEFMTGLEIFPTIANAVGARLRDDLILDGYDIMPVLKGEVESPRKEMYWESVQRGDFSQAAKIGKWKWVTDTRVGRSGLFNLEEDPAEQNDLSEEHPEILQWVRHKFDLWKNHMDNTEPRRPFDDF